MSDRRLSVQVLKEFARWGYAMFITFAVDLCFTKLALLLDCVVDFAPAMVLGSTSFVIGDNRALQVCKLEKEASKQKHTLRSRVGLGSISENFHSRKNPASTPGRGKKNHYLDYPKCLTDPHRWSLVEKPMHLDRRGGKMMEKQQHQCLPPWLTPNPLELKAPWFMNWNIMSLPLFPISYSVWLRPLPPTSCNALFRKLGKSNPCNSELPRLFKGKDFNHPSAPIPAVITRLLLSVFLICGMVVGSYTPIT